jgi:amino acid transporter
MAAEELASSRQRDGRGSSPQADRSLARGRGVLGVGSIALISIAAVLTLRNMPSVAEYGWSSIAYYVLGALFFFVPLSLVVAELGTGWPKAGGLYAWVKEGYYRPRSPWRMCTAAVSTARNSGRLVDQHASVSPRRPPSSANPAAHLRTRSRYSSQLHSTPPWWARSAGLSPWARAVAWNACVTVAACAVVLISVHSPFSCRITVWSSKLAPRGSGDGCRVTRSFVISGAIASPPIADARPW